LNATGRQPQKTGLVLSGKYTVAFLIPNFYLMFNYRVFFKDGEEYRSTAIIRKPAWYIRLILLPKENRKE
jgi:hypothetical protein